MPTMGELSGLALVRLWWSLAVQELWPLRAFCEAFGERAAAAHWRLGAVLSGPCARTAQKRAAKVGQRCCIMGEVSTQDAQ